MRRTIAVHARPRNLLLHCVKENTRAKPVALSADVREYDGFEGGPLLCVTPGETSPHLPALQYSRPSRFTMYAMKASRKIPCTSASIAFEQCIGLLMRVVGDIALLVAMVYGNMLAHATEILHQCIAPDVSDSHDNRAKRTPLRCCEYTMCFPLTPPTEQH